MSDDPVQGEVQELKLNLLKLVNMLVQALGLFLAAGAVGWGTNGTLKAGVTAGALTAGGYLLGNLQKTGGYRPTLQGLTEPTNQ